MAYYYVTPDNIYNDYNQPDGTINSTDGDDTYDAIASNGGSQIHIYARHGNDTINMGYEEITQFSNGHHVRGGHGASGGSSGVDTFNFTNLYQVKQGGVVVGRIEDFDASQDKIKICGALLDLNNVNSFAHQAVTSVRVVQFNGSHNDPGAAPQQWLLIKTTAGGHIFYALEGARIDMNGDGGANGGDQERHFVDSLDLPGFASLQTVQYEDPVNFAPAGLSPDGGLVINDTDADPSMVAQTIMGTGAGDLIAAGINDDRVEAKGGHDRVWGGSDHDTIFGGDGKDTLQGNPGDDSIAGDDGEDVISGQSGDDSLYGGNQNDALSGGAGADLLDGGDGDDDLSGGGSNDTLSGQGGNDVLSGVDGDDRLFGGAGNDTLNGDLGQDRAEGASGNDVISGHGGADSLYGGGQNDTLNGGSGNDLLDGGDGDDALNGGVNNDTLYGQGGNDVLSGVDGDDRLIGGAGADTLNGEVGRDRAEGQGGHDVLSGHGGADSLYGGLQNDTLNGGSGNDLLDGGDGADALNGGANNDTIYGRAGNDNLSGMAQNDVLIGGAGNDTLSGGAGNDTLSGGAGNDRFVFHTNQGVDRITDFAAHNNSEKIDLSGVVPIVGLTDLKNNHLQQWGDNAVIVVNTGHRIVVEDVHKNDLNAGDFIF